MARTRRPRSRRQPEILKPEPSKATKPTVIPVQKGAVGLTAARVTKNELAFLEDGLMDLEVTAISERNGNESPLLRLPAEIRMKTWKYVIPDGELVQPCRPPMTHSEHLADFDVAVLEYDAAFCEQRGVRVVHIPAEYRLPQVCHHIYVNTSTLIYSSNTFRFADSIIHLPLDDNEKSIMDYLGTESTMELTPWERWTAKLLPFQRNAVADVELECAAWNQYCLKDDNASQL